jgi:alkanesulfonate monooxygenase SsuD/methylene tetrahydromethanopterin reductase-like flavin-dependent oxidoreductase (luciferase family)
VGLNAFGEGEHHREECLDSAPAVILAAAASRTRRIRLASAVTVLCAADPVRVFQEFATLDLLSGRRAEIGAGRGSFIESFPLFGLELKDYDTLFAEELELLLQLRDETHVNWSGKFRPALNGQGVFPRPLREKLPIWLGVGGTPASHLRHRRLAGRTASGAGWLHPIPNLVLLWCFPQCFQTKPLALSSNQAIGAGVRILPHP